MKLSSLLLVCCLGFATMHIVADDELPSTNSSEAADDKCGCSAPKPQPQTPPAQG